MSNEYPQIAAIILAAGQGTRMKSEIPKVLHTIGGKPIVWHTLTMLNQLNIDNILIVIGYKEDQVKAQLGPSHNYISQKEQLGTGHAVSQSLPHLPPNISTIIVLNGDDSAFYQPNTVANFIDQHLKANAKMTIVTTIQKDVEISGRVIRNKDGDITGIKANSQMSEEELRNNNELVCGLYLFDRQWLEKYLPKVEISRSGEYNITGLIGIAIQQSSLQALKLPDSAQWQSINTQRELEKARRLWQQLSH